MGEVDKFRFEVWGGLGGKFLVSSNTRMARKLRRIILLHFGLVTFNFHFPKFPHIFIFMVFGLSGHDHGPQKTLYLTVDSQII